MSRKWVKKAEAEDPRLNIQLKTPEEVQLHTELKTLATAYGMTLHDVIIPLLHEAVARLRRRTLPLNTPLILKRKEK